MKVKMLLAATLATAAPAVAGPTHDHAPRPRTPPSAKHRARAPAPAKPAPPTVAATPRTLPNGSPACGNVQAKGTSSQREVRAACLRAEAAKQQGPK